MQGTISLNFSIIDAINRRNQTIRELNINTKEKRFLNELESLFTGAEVEGDSGFVNLMRMKRAWFHSIRPKLMEEIDKRAEKDTSFREELFDKLYTFFHRYFCESGSIYFRHLPAFAKTYERVYADGQDVALSWKTQMLYYVKSDVLVRSMPVELSEQGKPQNTRRFYFDASEFEHKKNNERREFIFVFDEVKRETAGRVIPLKVSYSQKGSRTKSDEIIKQARKAGASLTDDELQKAFRVFKRQTEADFFINKDARGFLREQFDLWLYQYIFSEETIFETKRIAQLQAIKEIADNIIDFIAQFEDELRRAWEKPKFVRNVNYVVTLDKLTDKTLNKIIKHKGTKAQTKEWRELGMVNDKFSMKEIFNGQRSFDDKNGASGDYKFLPLDTKHFKDLEVEILACLGNLDETLDGELVHSENWQALNTLQRRYKGKVKCIYIDPPFNLGDSDQFDYRTSYKDSCWATMLENRLSLGRELLSDDGTIFVRCDYNGNWIVRCLLNGVFDEKNFRNEIIISKSGIAQSFMYDRFNPSVESLFLYGKTENAKIIPQTTERPSERIKWVDMHIYKENKNANTVTYNGEDFVAPRTRHLPSQKLVDQLSKENRVWVVEKNYTDVYGNKKNRMLQYLMKNYDILENNWLDIAGYSPTTAFKTENSEALLHRTILSTMGGSEYMLDFFAGSGTTQAVAQKLGRKWLGVEMGDHFDTIILPRMKKVLGGKKQGISKEIDYKGGGFFKYYSLEQYEETLKNARYEDGEQLELDSAKSPFEQYIFFGDDKLAHAVKPLKNGNLKINLHDLYPDIDIAESLSNILGKPIRKRTADSVTFADGTMEKINPATMTEEQKRHFISLLKPYLWWGE